MRTITAARLRTLGSEELVLQLVRDFVAEWLPEELAVLPPHCRPHNIRDIEELNEITFCLTQEKFARRPAGDNDRVLEMQSFLAQACARIAEIKADLAHQRARKSVANRV